MMFPGFGMGGWMIVAGFGLLIVLGVLTLVAALVGLSRRPQNASDRALDDPSKILAQRFARGEMDDDEYFRRLSALDNSSSSPGLPRLGR